MTARPAFARSQAPRNAPCGCGSGRRFKACHGRIEAAPRMSDAVFEQVMHASLAAQRAGRLDEARAGYENVLAQRPDAPDALNMLGVIDLAQGDLESALRRLRRAVDAFDPHHLDAVHNLGCALSAWSVRDATERTERLWIDATRAAAMHDPPVHTGRISVVVPSHDHAAYIVEALESALAQSRPPDEIVVVDDGSTDASVERIREVARRHPGRIRLVARECRGAAATINEAISMSTGDWIGILNSDDRFAPDRLARMHHAIGGRSDGWGFSRCRFIDEASLPLESSNRINLALHRALVDAVGACDTVGYAFLAGNPAISTGTLFFARTLFDRVGGFRDFRYNHDWDFCLRATSRAEPVFEPAPLYDYRVHGANTIHEAFERRKQEADAMLAGYYRDVLASGPPANPFAPSVHRWGRLFLVRAIEHGHAKLLPEGTVERIVDDILAQPRESSDVV